MRNFMRMGSVALSAAFLSIAAQSAASAQGNPDVNPNVERAMNRAAQVNRDVDTDTTQQQTTHRRSTQLTVDVPSNVPSRPRSAAETSLGLQRRFPNARNLVFNPEQFLAPIEFFLRAMESAGGRP
jgi:hypothetical protein